jgi:hypothetical protein
MGLCEPRLPGRMVRPYMIKRSQTSRGVRKSSMPSVMRSWPAVGAALYVRTGDPTGQGKHDFAPAASGDSIQDVRLELGEVRDRFENGKRLIAEGPCEAIRQSETVTRKNVAGMEVMSLRELLFCALNRSSSCLCRSATRPLLFAASKAFMVGP